MSNLKDRLLTQFQLAHQEAEIEGAVVFIKQLSNAQVETYQFRRINMKTGEADYAKIQGAKAELVAMCLCDEDGVLVFKTGKELGEALPKTFVDAAHEKCMDVNSMNIDIEEAGKD